MVKYCDCDQMRIPVDPGSLAALTFLALVCVHRHAGVELRQLTLVLRALHLLQLNFSLQLPRQRKVACLPSASIQYQFDTSVFI